MGVLAEKYRPAEVERAARELWAARGLPRADGVVGGSTAPIVRQFEGALISGDDPGLVAFRAVAADIDARYLALAGRRALGTLRRDGPPDEPALSLLRSLSIWSGGASGSPVDATDRRPGVEAILGRMAASGLVVTRDTSLRICPSCAQARTPERIVYQQEEGDTYLVRFPVPEGEGTVHAIVWVDAPWRLLGASALLVSPNLPYVVARYRRRGVDEKILTSRPSLARLLEWLPGGEVEVLEEATGARWQGRVYQYPLRHEFPMGGELTAPSGTILAVPDVTDSGTGIVPLVPGHGGTDAQIADRLGIAGWPLVTARGQLDFNLAHKYSGLDIPTANEFVARDLAESGALFARLRVRRGVPHCVTCGTPLVWAPGRAWCLEPSGLPAARRDLYRRLLPGDPPVGQVEVAAWPVSEPHTSPAGPSVVTLLECSRCERLAPVGSQGECVCGTRRNAVSRRLLPSMAGALGAWARFDPFPPGDPVWLYLNERRRAPALVHHLAVMCGVPGSPAEVGLTLLPGVPEGGMAELIAAQGADAVRGALVQGERRERSGPTFPDRCRQESRRLERWWNIARETLDRCDPALLAAFAQPIAGSLAELEPEDRAILARWERVRLAALADYDHQAAGSAQRRLTTFLTNDLGRYFSRVRPRLERAGTTPSRRAALRTLHHVLRGASVALAPVSPHISEAVHTALVPARTSLFEVPIDPLDSALLDEEASKAWDRWGSLVEAVDRFRRRVGLARDSVIPTLAAIVSTDELAARLRTERATVQRLTHVAKFDAFGPATPWTGRNRSLEPVLSEIQRVYPTEAGQIVHLLKRLPARRRGEAVASEELSVVVNGVSRRILPSMVAYAETLPDRVLPAPWSLGELYAELPASQPLPARNPPPVSPDAFRLIALAERELRRNPAGGSGAREPVLIAVVDPLASELRASAAALASYLGVPEVRVVDPSAEFPRANCLFGRTRTGVHWWIRVSSGPGRPPREKHRPARPRLARVRARRPGLLTAVGEVDFASPEEISKEEQIRALAQELDGVLGAPLLGPSKVASAWAAGFHTVADFGAAPFDRVEGIRGFGSPIADALVRKLGGTVPSRSPRRPAATGPRPEEYVPPASAPGGNGTGLEIPARRRPNFGSGGSVRTTDVTTPSPAKYPPTPPSTPVPPSLPPTLPASSPTEPAPASAEVRLPPSPPPILVVTDSQGPLPKSQPTPGADEPESPPAVPDREGAESTAPASVAETPILRSDAPGLPSPAEAEELLAPIPEIPPVSEARPPDLPQAVGGGASEAAPEWTPQEPLTPSVPSTQESVETTRTEVTATEPSPTVASAESAFPEIPNSSDDPSGGDGSSAPLGSEIPPPPLLLSAPAEVEAPETSDTPASELLPTDTLSDPEAAPIPELEGPPARPDASNPSTSSRAPPLEEALAPSAPPEEVLPPVAVPPDGATPEPEPSGTLEEQLEPPTRAAESEVLTPSETSESLAPPATAEEEVVVVDELVRETPAPPEPPVPEPDLSGAAPGPGAGTPEPSPPAVPLPPPTPTGGLSLAVAPSYLPAFSRFLDATAAGHRGICVVRESPDRLRAHVGPRPVEIYWLTNLGRGLTLRPNDLDGYGAFLQKSVEQDRVTAFFLEGIEYLARVHGTERVIDVLAKFQVQAEANSARVWVYLHPDLLPAADLELFVSAFGSAPSND